MLEIADNLQTNITVPDWRHLVKTFNFYSFEDIPGKRMGYCTWENTLRGTNQLAFAVSTSDHPVAVEWVRQRTQEDQDPQTVQELQDEQIFAGRKFIDLGCGRSPAFALAAKSMGAVVCTADAQPLDPNIAKKLDGHVELDLNKPSAVTLLEGNFGNDFDLVTEGITNILPAQEGLLTKPSAETMQIIGERLLKPGGLLHLSTTAQASQRVLQKPR